MNLTIWKFAIEFRNGDRHRIPMPIGAEVLSAQVQEKDLRLWALIDTDAEREIREFILVGTGTPFLEPRGNVRFVGTVQLHEGHLVLHVFEVLQ